MPALSLPTARCVSCISQAPAAALGPLALTFEFLITGHYLAKLFYHFQ